MSRDGFWGTRRASLHRPGPRLTLAARVRLGALRVRARRGFENEAERERVSAAMAHNLLKSAVWQQARTVFLFVGTPWEPDTSPLVRAAWEQGKRVCLPRCEGAGVMTAHLVLPDTPLVPGAFGILEPPADAPPVRREAIDLVVAPCTACDRRGGRLGQGGGYYDRFLSGTGMTKIALCPSSRLVRRLPVTPHDVAMDGVVTEEETLLF